MFQKKKWISVAALLVIVLLINLPIVSALEISNVRAEDVTDTSVTIKWETDEPADSFLNYGKEKTDLKTIGDASTVTNHAMPVSELKPETAYYYSVKSNDKVDDNSGSLYSFTTPAPDTTPPELSVEIPTAIKGNKLSITGYTEVGAKVTIYVDGVFRADTVAVSRMVRLIEAAAAAGNIASEGGEPVAGEAAGTGGTQLEGMFTFSDILLSNNKENTIKIEVEDKAENKASQEGSVFADTSKPKLTLEKLPDFVGENKFTLKGTISENCSFEIFVNNKSVSKGEGKTINQEIRLEEGSNLVSINLKDAAGWENSEEFAIVTDTKPPTVKFDFSKGKEFYQGRAVSDIAGETEAGAEVYLYVYRPLGYGYSPKFNKAWEKVTADENGNFVFGDVNFEFKPISLEDLAPKQVPSGLEQESIFPIEEVQAKQKWTYYVYVIAEDKSGKTAYAKKTIMVNTCYSADFGFDVISIPQFQAPLRLNPTLLDDGRETFTAVINLSYRGQGVSSQGQVPFKIQKVQFEKACTQGMLDDEGTKLGCTIFPSAPSKTLNGDLTAWYITGNLFSSEKLSEGKEDFWNEFKKRQIVYPMKIKVTYQENLGGGKMSELKTQVSCYDLTYFVDIPVDSKNMLPDFIAEEGLEAIEWTIDKIDLILPYLEKAILIVGIAWVSSFLGRMAVRYTRMVTSKLEAYFSSGKSDDEKCPADQNTLYLESDIKHWKELSQKAPNEFDTGGLRTDWDDVEKSLDKLCPTTAGLWKAEATLDKLYKWSGDRVLCRAVPAGWTSTAEKNEVDTVIAKQSQCAESGLGTPLKEIENCEEKIKENTNVAVNPKAASKINKGSFTCYQNGNFLYTVKPEYKKFESQADGQIMELELVHDFGLSIQQAEMYAGQGNLLAYKPKGSDQYIIAQDKTCEQACSNRRRSGYRPYLELSRKTINIKTGKEGVYGCFEERIDNLGEKIFVDVNGNPIGSNLETKTYSAGYTSDCFIDVEKGSTTLSSEANAGAKCSTNSECLGGAVCLAGNCNQSTSSGLTPKGKGSKGQTGLLQCICVYDEGKGKEYVGVHNAMKETEEGVAEEWDYRQDQIFFSSKNRFGTYYPEWRYYEGRDFSSAFGADYLLDYMRDEKEVHQVSPNTQFIGAYQTLCLSRIRAHLLTLKSILEGLRNCIQEAKITGLRDAGVCKTIFTQQICGLIYKAIAYFFTSCSPYGVGDSESDSLGAVGAIGEATLGSVGEAMQSSIDDVKRDYNNAFLNNYFSAGAQGFSESICMAAFGYDWPLGADFILDAAYSVPGKSSVLVTPAFRELSSYDPVTGNAVYNYEIGAMVLPGCSIRSYNVYLKCAGPEDREKPGVNCGKQGCDCIQAQGQSSFENEKTYPLEGGRGFGGLERNSFFSVPIPSPQKVNSHFRYDHVVVELKLDQSEKGNEGKCFEEGYEDGLFYFSVVDVSPPGAGVCQVQLNGQYFCPEFVKMFSGGQGAFLQEPYITCFDEETQSWANCDTPNLYTKGDQIKVKANVVTDGKEYCLKFSTSGLGQRTELIRQLPTGIAGQFQPEYFVDTVREELFTGATTTIVLSGGNKNCEDQLKFSGSLETSKDITFKYQVHGDKYKVFVPSGVKVTTSGYEDKGPLTLEGRNLLTSEEVKAAEFDYNGFKFSNIIGSPAEDGECTYRIRPAAGTEYAKKEKTITVTAELFLPDAAGNCYNAKERVKPSGFGESSHSQPITIRLESVESQVISSMHANFVKKNYPAVKNEALGITQRGNSDLEDAVAIYYLAASYIMQGKETDIGWKQAVGDDVCHLVKLFKLRDDGRGNTLAGYSESVKSTAEYQKVDKYLAQINDEAQCGVMW